MRMFFNPPSPPKADSADEKVLFNSPGLAPEKRVQGLPWGLIPSIIFLTSGFRGKARLLMFFFLLQIGASLVNAQVTVITTVNPTNNIFLEDLVYNTNISITTAGGYGGVECFFRFHLVGDNGVELRTPDNYYSADPIILADGANPPVTASLLLGYFTTDAFIISGTTAASLQTNGLPPGNYTLCTGLMSDGVFLTPPEPAGCSNSFAVPDLKVTVESIIPTPNMMMLSDLLTSSTILLRANRSGDITLALEITNEEAGISIISRTGFNPGSPISLEANTLYSVNSIDLAPYLEESALLVTGMSADDLFEHGLPGGTYTICIKTLRDGVDVTNTLSPNCSAPVMVSGISVNVLSAQVIPPFTESFADYGNKTMLTLQANRTVSVTLRLRVEGDNGITISTPQNHIPADDILLQANTPRILSGAEISEYFEESALLATGMSVEELFTNGLPEGNYKLCASVYYNNELVSATNAACSNMFSVTFLPAPMLITPANVSRIENTKMQNIVFSWSPSPGSPPWTEYTLKIVELTDPSMSPEDAMLSAGIPYYEEKIQGTAMFYGPGHPLLDRGKRYAFQVVAADSESGRKFENYGHSEVYSFTYGEFEENIFSFNAEPVMVEKPDVVSGMQWTFPNTSATGIMRYKFPQTPANKGPLKDISLKLVLGYYVLTNTNEKVYLYNWPQNNNPVSQKKASGQYGFETYVDFNTDTLPSGGDIISHTYTNDQGEYTFQFNNPGLGLVAKDIVTSWSYLVEGAATQQIDINTTIQMPSTVVEEAVGDLYMYARIVVDNPYYCSLEKDFLLPPGSNNLGVNDVKVRSYNLEVNVKADDRFAEQYRDYSVESMIVYLLRQHRPHGVPLTEGSAEIPISPGEKIEGMDVVAKGITRNDGKATLYNLVKCVTNNPSDKYFLFAEAKSTTEVNYRSEFAVDYRYAYYDDHAFYNSEYTLPSPTPAKELIAIPLPPYIEGSVYRFDSQGTPVEDAQIILIKNQKWYSSDLTDDKGRFKRETPDAKKTDHWMFIVKKEGYKQQLLPVPIELQLGTKYTREDILLEPESTISGIVKDEDGKGIPVQIRMDDGNYQLFTPNCIMESIVTTGQAQAAIVTTPFQQTGNATFVNASNTGTNSGNLKVRSNLSFQQTGGVTQSSFQNIAGQMVSQTNHAAGLFEPSCTVPTRFNIKSTSGEHKIIVNPTNSEYFNDTITVHVAKGDNLIEPIIIYRKERRVKVNVYYLPPTDNVSPTATGEGNHKKGTTQTSSVVNISSQNTNVKPVSAQVNNIKASENNLGFQASPGGIDYTSVVYNYVPSNAVPLPNAQVEIEHVASKTTNDEGFAKFNFSNSSPEFNIIVKGPEGKNYVAKSKTATIPVSKEYKIINVVLDVAGEVSGIVYAGKTESSPVANARVYADITGGSKIEVVTNDAGEYNLKNVPLNRELSLWAVKSASNYIGDSVRVVVSSSDVNGNTPFHKTDVDFHLTVYEDMDITQLLGFPIEVTSLSENNGNVNISGNFSGLPANEYFAQNKNETNLQFKDISIVPSPNLKNQNGVPLSVPKNKKVPTDKNNIELDIYTKFAGHLQGDQTLGVELIDADEGTGAIMGTIELNPASCNSGFLAFSEPVYVSGTDEAGQLKTIAFTNKPDEMNYVNGLHISNEKGEALQVKMGDYDVECNPESSFLHQDLIKLDARLQTSMAHLDPSNLNMPLGTIVFSKNSSNELIFHAQSGTDYNLPLSSGSQPWSLHIDQWVFTKQQGIVFKEGYLNTGILTVPFTDIYLEQASDSTHLTGGKYELSQLSLGNVVPLTITGDKQFVYDMGRNCWKLSISAPTGQSCAYFEGLPGMASTDRVEFQNFFFVSNSYPVFNLSSNTKPITLYHVAEFTPGMIDVNDGELAIAGRADFGIPYMNNGDLLGYKIFYQRENGQIVFKNKSENFLITPPGPVTMEFFSTEGSQILGQQGFVAVGKTYEQLPAGKLFEFESTLFRTVDSTSLIVNDNQQFRFTGGYNSPMLDKVHGRMFVQGSQWSDFTFGGDLKNAAGAEGYLSFVVEGDLIGKKNNIEVKNIPGPFQGITNLTYDFDNKRFTATLDIDKTLQGGASFSVSAELLLDPGGWYFLGTGSMSIPTPSLSGQAAVFIGNYTVNNYIRDVFIPVSRIHQIFGYEPPNFPKAGNKFSGFYIQGGVGLPIPIIPQFEFDLGLISAQLSHEFGADVRMSMNFAESLTYHMGMSVYGKVTAGLGASMGLVCASSSVTGKGLVSADGLYSLDGSWKVDGYAEFGISGTTELGTGACDSDCDGILGVGPCIVKSESAGVTLFGTFSKSPGNTHFEIGFK